MKVLSLGAGVNSTAILVKKAQGDPNYDFDEAIIADTGEESRKTYEFIKEVIKPYCEKYNIKLTILKASESLSEHCKKRGIIPSRNFGWCRDKFKIQLIRKYLKNTYPNLWKSKDIETIIGFCVGEEKRVKGYKAITAKYSFPLYRMGVNRRGCVKIIQDSGLPIPPKSGCDICPHQPLESWIALYNNDPEAYARAEELEKNGKRYPELFLSWDYPLETLRHLLEANKKDMTEQEKQSATKMLYAYMPKTPGCAMCEIEDNTCLIEALIDAKVMEKKP